MLGWIFTGASMVLNIVQAIRDWNKKSKWDAAKVQLEQVRAMCAEAIEKGGSY